MEEKSHIKYYLGKLILFLIIAVMVFVFKTPLVENLKYFIGGLMLLYGLEEILFEIIYSRHHLLHKDKIYLGFIETLFGIVMLCALMSYESVCIIWATWSILRESYEIKEIVAEYKALAPRIISGVESIAVIVFSILLILEPGEHHAMIHLYLLLLELTLAPLVPLIEELIMSKAKNN